MSTKIYDAYRLKQSDQIWSLLKEIRERGKANVIKKLEEVYWKKLIQIDPEGAEYQKELASRKKWNKSTTDSSIPDISIRLTIIHEKLMKRFKEHIGSHNRSFYDLDVSVAIYAHSTGFYLRTSCDNVSCLGGSLDFIEEHPLLEDFHYQNSIDRPKDVSPEDWEHREKVWDDLMEGGITLYASANLYVSSWEQYWDLDPYVSLSQKYHKDPPTIPIREDVLAGCLRKLDAFENVEATKGLIIAMPGNITIKKEGTEWVSTIGDQRKTHPSLDHAVYHVQHEHLPPDVKQMVERMIAQSVKPCDSEVPTCAPAPEDSLGCQ